MAIVSLSLDSIPFAYLQNEEIIGYDVELMYLIAEELGYGLDISSCDFSALISGIASEREDIAIGCITYTEERAESVLFTDNRIEGEEGYVNATYGLHSGRFVLSLRKCRGNFSSAKR